MTPVFEQDEVLAGQSLEGPAIVESPSATFAVPPGRVARLDGNRIFHLGESTNELRTENL
jgi:acetone carboxylase beta subunit